jgi:hypothetical protein
MMEVKREDLYMNLDARIRYLHSFIDFGSSTLFLFCSLSITQFG